ncbi:MAG: hypothetical protein AAF363_11575 [Bacteroidota bacterium]
MEAHTIIGSLGVSLLLLAYLMHLLRWIESTNIWYRLLNIIGALLAAWSSYLLNFLPFIILEGTWAVVSAAALLQTKKVLEPKIN